jgi:recombination protein RecA
MDAEKMKLIKGALDKIDKDFGKGTVMQLGDKEIRPIEVISTGSLTLDIALGVGGVPKGRIIEIYGPESAGKTTVATQIIAEAQKQGGACCIIDAEHAFDTSYAKQLGVDVDNLFVSQPDYGEQALEILDRLLNTKSFDVIVVDSVAALTPKAELEGEMGDSKMGLHARLMSQALRKTTSIISKSNTVVIFINQLREKIGVMFGCFSYDSRVVFADGTTEKIGKIVNQRINKPILSMNSKGEVVESKIIDWFNNGNADKWLRFVVDKGAGNGRSQFKVTSNHLLFTKDGEIPAGELKVGDFVRRVENHYLNDDQKQIVLGSMIGDGHMKKSSRQLKKQPSDAAPTLAIHHSNLLHHQGQYCQWKHKLFNTQANEYNYEAESFVTKPLPEFRNYTRQRVIQDLNLKGIAIMYMDDGSFNVDRCFVYKKWPNKDLISLHDKIFELTGAKGSVSEKYGRITYTTAQMRLFQDAIKIYMHSSMCYKIHDGKVGGYVWDMINIKKQFVGDGIIRQIREVQPKNRSQIKKYDLQIADTECYNVDGVFVHNSPETTTGGNALKFYASVRLDIRRQSQIKDGDNVIGNRTKVKVVKNKVAPPFKTAEYDLIWGEGVSKTGEIIDLAVDLSIVQKSGSWFSYEGSKLGQGREAVKVVLADNPELAAELEGKIRALLIETKQ